MKRFLETNPVLFVFAHMFVHFYLTILFTKRMRLLSSMGKKPPEKPPPEYTSPVKGGLSGEIPAPRLDIFFSYVLKFVVFSVNNRSCLTCLSRELSSALA